MENKRIFLTGATGLIGSRLIESLSRTPFNIKAISRYVQLPLKNVEWILSDISKDNFELCKHIESTDIIIHNAACLKEGRTQGETDEIKKVNIDFTEKLMGCAVRMNVKKIIYTSSLSLIKKPLPNLITETSELLPVSAYAKSKYIGEQIIQENSIKNGIDFTILRLSSPIPFNYVSLPNTVVKKWIDQSSLKEKIQVYGKGERTQDFVAVTDIVSAFFNIINNENTNGIFNIASGNSISMLGLAELITKKYNNLYEFCELDDNENDRWNISIKEAKQVFDYKPSYKSEEVIQELLNFIDH